ncbi:hypothetical protein LEP3755_34240 [Leptolyngbya sp. NIES-3755]|nr:hypothetical protein LEP3755_34240 [Leptolyngbya sp. NIES-3755]
MQNQIILSGSGGGKGSSSTPREASDNLKSQSFANILLAISEGPIAGFVDNSNWFKSIYLDGTPIVSAIGYQNFKEVEAHLRFGLPDQDPIQGFTRLKSEIPVDVEVKQANPIVRTIVDDDADYAVVRIQTPALFNTDSKGNINGTEIRYLIELSINGGPYNPVVQGLISGKTSSTYEESQAIQLPPNPGNRWDIKVSRITADSTTIKLQNSLRWASYQVVQKETKTFPNVALLALRINSQQFTSVPSVAIYQRGIACRIPNNYDPIHRTYIGNFDGSLRSYWTNNPAWILWTALTNDRWGCGIPESELDVWSFYEAARYCDELVPSVGSQVEPRYSFNAYLNSSQDAFDLIGQIASSMRAQVWWNGSRIVLSQDRPTPVARMFSPSHVVYQYDEEGRMTGGGFQYVSTDLSTRYTSVVVRYLNPQTWEEDSVLVEDAELINLWGFRQLEITAVGCTSRTQAERFGRWELYVATKQTEVVSFSLASEGLRERVTFLRE